MKKHVAILTTALALTFGLTLSAGATETSGIQVQLDGKNLSFTDAIPQIKDQRTFLPFRAVFEAMGAKVDNQGDVITAAKDGRTVTMTLGSSQATVTENGVSTSLSMDVAPYVDNATWRTYVPVRFAAQAMGCAVGWDQDDSTVILVDTGKLLAEAKVGKSYTWLKKFTDYSAKYQEGIWDCSLNYDGSMTTQGLPMAIGGYTDATIDGSTKVEMDMNMTVDMTDFLAAMQEAQASALTAEEKAMLETLATDGIDMTILGDLEKGQLYMNMNMGGELTAATGMDPNTWYAMDLNAMYQQAGLNLNMDQLIGMVKADYSNYILNMMEAGLQAADVNDVNAYPGMVEMAQELAALFADDRFTKNGNDYVCSYRTDEANASLELTLTLNTSNGAVVGYAFEMGMYTPADVAAGVPATSMEMTARLDAKDQMTAHVSTEMGSMAAMEMTMTGSYAKGTTAPRTQPPAGATVVPYESLTAMPE